MSTDSLDQSAYDHLWMHFTRMSGYRDSPVPTIVRGEGARIYDKNGRSYLDGLAGLFVVQAGHGRVELAEAAYKQAQELAFFPLWSYAHPQAIELADRLAAEAPGRPEQGLLHHRRRRGRGDRVEAGQAVLQADRQADEAQGHQPQHRLPRHPAGRAVDHRHPGRQEVLRAAGPRRVQGPEHQLLPRRGDHRRPGHGPGPGGVRPLVRRPGGEDDPGRGPGHRRRRVRRAGAELRRLLPAAARVLRSAARDLRHLRRAAGLRRGDLRVRPAGHDVRRRQVRLRPGHHHLRQGPRPRATPRSARPSSPTASPSPSTRAPTTSRTATPSAGTRCPRPSRWPTSTCSSARA